jgi:hypothetical protein
MSRSSAKVDGTNWLYTVEKNLSFLGNVYLKEFSFTESEMDEKLDTFLLVYIFDYEGVEFTLRVTSKRHSRRLGTFAVRMKDSSTGSEVFEARWDQDIAVLEQKMTDTLKYICGLPDNVQLIYRKTGNLYKKSAFAMILDQCARLGI